MTSDELRKALKRAYSLGQTYWSQADSEYHSDWKRADVTAATFNEFVETTVASFEAQGEKHDPA